MSMVLSRIGIELPDVIDEGMIGGISKAMSKSSGLLKRQLQMVLCIVYSNVFKNPLVRLFKMLFNGDLQAMAVLSIRLKAYFCRPEKLTELNNLVTSPNQLIFEQ